MVWLVLCAFTFMLSSEVFFLKVQNCPVPKQRRGSGGGSHVNVLAWEFYKYHLIDKYIVHYKYVTF